MRVHQVHRPIRRAVRAHLVVRDHPAARAQVPVHDQVLRLLLAAHRAIHHRQREPKVKESKCFDYVICYTARFDD